MADVRTHDDVTSEVVHPRPKPVGPVDARRILTASLLVAAVAAAVLVIVRSVGDGPAATVLAAALGFAVVPLVAAPIEWFVHRFVYHEAVIRPLAAIFKVHTAHHFAYFPTWRYVTSGPARRLSIRSHHPDVHESPLRNGMVRLAHFSWYMTFGVVVIWLPAWWATGSGPFLAGIVIGSATVSNLFIVVHDTIHRPRSHRVVEAQPWFAFLDRHHYIHHVDLGANLNFLLPLGDLLFGTLRTSLTAEELAAHGPLARAKAHPAGRGERALGAPA